MRIISVVTLVSPTGEYGGPVRVAINQARALREAGHDVTIAGAHRGFDGTPPREIEGVPATLFTARTALPGTGFAGLSAPGLRKWLIKAAAEADVVHIHAARDLVTLPAADAMRRHSIPYVLQTHGMIDPSTNPLARPLDALMTRAVLKGASTVFYLTPTERRSLEAVGGAGLTLAELRNGVPAAPPRADPEGVEVLYLARLAPRKRPELFVRTANALADDFPDVRFRLVGPDEGRADEVSRLIGESHADIVWEGPLAPEHTTERLARASVYVLPAVDEPYPMSVLEAMASELPVVVTDSCGLAPAIREAGAGIVVDDSPSQLISAVRALLSDPVRRTEMGRRALQASIEKFSMTAIAENLLQVYRGAAAGREAIGKRAGAPRSPRD